MEIKAEVIRPNVIVEGFMSDFSAVLGLSFL